MAEINFASKYAGKVDEKFSRQSVAQLVTNQDYSFTGVKTVNVYSIPTVPMTDYQRSGTNRYGTPSDLGSTTQELTLGRDRSFTFAIDKADRNQTMMTMDAGKALARQLDLEVIPEYDTYVLAAIADAVNGYTDENGAAHTASTALTTSNAYAEFLKAQEILGNCNVPEAGRVCLCSYAFAGLLKQDTAFMRECDAAQDMQVKGILGEVDGVKLVRVPASRLPNGCNFIMTHPMATVAPRQLNEYKIHDNPPGINGWLIEGRLIYDAHVLNNKKDAIFYHGTQG
ncbi:MAG: N4-gp56 family major capsid protein [Oscillospiraceae bacterium]|nr:N4-gp56 family major capsid protein [Oscillospiraceae bacterium]